MTIRTLSLDSDDGARWLVSATEAPAGTPAAALPTDIAAHVPGVVHTDLLAAGLIPDPYLDLNEEELGWIGHTTWRYRTQFTWAPDGHERTDLVFDGLDTVASIRLNGITLGETANQHRSYRFRVEDALVEGANELEVSFSSAWDHAENLAAAQGPLPNAYPTPFNFIRKMAANFGWDWGPQLVTAGMWKGVRLESWSTARIASWETTVTATEQTGSARVTVEVEWSQQPIPGFSLEADVAGVQVSAEVAGSTTRLVLDVPDPELWWPRGLGRQPLSDLRVVLKNGATSFDERSRRIGFRSVELDTREDAEGRAFTIVVNGRPVFVRGANWIPDDCFPSRVTAERYRERIQQAADANLNLLRVWGGGIYESDDFYDACDELGIMTWQDFLFACAAYPEEEPLRSEVQAEATENVRRIGGHPSLVLWNGCNENIWGWYDWGWQSVVGDRTWGLGYYTELLPAVVATIDPGTPYWPGSPFSGTSEEHPNEPSRGNIHIWDVWNQVDYKEYARYRPRFVSEFGFQGPPQWSTIARSIHDEPLAEDSPGMLLHQKAEDGNGKLKRGMAPHLPDPENFEQWHYLTQLNQARAIEFAIEHFRALSPLCMGTIVWQLNDCWPVTSWAAIDGDGRRKPLWHGIRRANEPTLLTLQPSPAGLELIAVNDSADDWTVAGELARYNTAGKELATAPFALTVAPGERSSLQVADSLLPSEPMTEYLAVIAPGRRSLVHTFVEDRELELVPAEIEFSIGDWEEGTQTMTLTTSTGARGVVIAADRIHPDAWADDSDIDLLPNRPVQVTMHTPHPLTRQELERPGVIADLSSLVINSQAVAGAARGR
jgi:beta-mannosidase